MEDDRANSLSKSEAPQGLFWRTGVEAPKVGHPPTSPRKAVGGSIFSFEATNNFTDPQGADASMFGSSHPGPRDSETLASSFLTNEGAESSGEGSRSRDSLDPQLDQGGVGRYTQCSTEQHASLSREANQTPGEINQIAIPDLGVHTGHDMTDNTDIPPDKRRETLRTNVHKLKTKAHIKVAALNIRGIGNSDVSHPDNKWVHINQLLRDEKIGILVVGEAHLNPR
ncbi:hypothetical protein GGU11DRAFT_747449 [Lentinula aff. detonsa]|nr:hypothetical protein GGU11DRAFT_747449 [Lentinula aff. detonsa]